METYAYYENDRIFDLYENESRDKYDIGQDLYALLDQSDDHFIPEDFSHGLKVVLAVLYSFLSAGALVGNACVLVVILTHPAIRTVTNTFIVSLAASDALIAAWNMPLQLVFYVRNEWGLGEGMCKVTSFVQGVSILASILTLTGISIERYYVICNPIKARHIRSTRTALVTVLLLWLVAMVIMIPNLWIQRLETRLAWQHGEDPPIKIVHICVEQFPKFVYNVAYTYGHFSVLFLVPVCVMIYAYIRMGRILWYRKYIGEPIFATQMKDKREEQKRNIVRMLLVIVLCFVICWFPFFAIHLVLVHCKLNKTFRVLVSFAKAFGYSNSFINPIIYFFLNAKFNRVLRNILPCKNFCNLRTRTARYSRKPNTQVSTA